MLPGLLLPISGCLHQLRRQTAAMQDYLTGTSLHLVTFLNQWVTSIELTYYFTLFYLGAPPHGRMVALPPQRHHAL